MMSLKEYMLSDKKENVYAFYQRLNIKASDYEKITRNDIYRNIISLYKDDPEIILRLCSMEEIQILKKLLDGKIKKQANGYIDYLLFRHLQHNYLILEDKGEYYIPNDIINYVKMALNLFEEQVYSMQDVGDSVLLGIGTVYNALVISDVVELLKGYYIQYDTDIKTYIKNNPKLNDKISVIRYKKQDYLVSTEFPYYKDVLSLHKDIDLAHYSLEEMISFGKYKINLFQESILNFLNFLEMHLDAYYIEVLLNDLIFYCGFDINNESLLLQICDNIEDLYKEIKKVDAYFPIWIYYGNHLVSLDEKLMEKEKGNQNKKKVSFWDKIFKRNGA